MSSTTTLSGPHAEEAARYLEKMRAGMQTTQEILDSGAIPALKGFKVIPGKVSDSIMGGPISYMEKGKLVEHVNPPLIGANGRPLRILVRTERISTHDISRGVIPFKDQYLALNHNFMRSLLEPHMPHAQLDCGLSDLSVVSMCENVHRLPIENVIRAYMAETTTSTSIYQHWLKDPNGTFCGIPLGKYKLAPNGKLPYPMVTPSTKNEKDRSVTIEELFEPGAFEPYQWDSVRNTSLAAFGVVSSYLLTKNIILVDTKTEHGVDAEGNIIAIDELYTMDSSRFWKADSRGDLLLDEKQKPISFSKEFARTLSKSDQPYTAEEQIQISVRYREGIEHLIGDAFSPSLDPWNERVIHDVNSGLKCVL